MKEPLRRNVDEIVKDQKSVMQMVLGHTSRKIAARKIKRERTAKRRSAVVRIKKMEVQLPRLAMRLISLRQKLRGIRKVTLMPAISALGMSSEIKNVRSISLSV